ncbi:uncharacterized protein LOC120937847 isoform X2 [Rana temporaria]|uniref:uncharacterized protein LOC120937847 isoform X2 n=1 Tax=Rana temporaria TaxID=8407 RepID=UPI001AACAD6E|nr:uncharacterized protein LOC120937847 isoform X2 [Rana temporaria]
MALSSPQVIGENTEGDKLRNYYCDLCSKTCDSANHLAGHLLGRKHQHKLKTIKSQEQKDESRLSSFLKTHMKEEPIVGLEYIIERKKDSIYTYTCQLCGLPICNLPTIVIHLLSSSHTRCYIKKHFPHLMPKSPTKQHSVEIMRDVLVTILELQGNKKQIQVVLLESGGNVREASEDTPPSKPKSDGKMREASEDTPPSKPKSDGKTREASKDAPPSKPKSDGKTREASKDAPPSKPKSDGKTREASKDTPPSKPKSGNISHLKLSPLPNQESRKSYRYNKMLQKSNRNDPPLAKRSRRSPGGNQDVLPSTSHSSKRGSSHYNKSHAIRRDCTAIQELEFRTNNEFFEYFANFVISDDEDVVFIRTITQNCIKALTRFKQEEIERRKTGQQPEAPLEDTSRTAHKIPGILEDETESHLSHFETSLFKEHCKTKA